MRPAGSPGTAGARFRADEPCLMPIGRDRLCTLPGDHPHDDGCTDGGTQEWNTPCARCRHRKGMHSFSRQGKPICWGVVCGCAGFIAKEPEK